MFIGSVNFFKGSTNYKKLFSILFILFFNKLRQLFKKRFESENKNISFKCNFWGRGKELQKYITFRFKNLNIIIIII